MANTYRGCSGPASGSLEVAQHAGAFFPNSHSFVVSGGEFTSVTNIYQSPPQRPDFRMVPLGDLDLRHEIKRGMVSIQHRRGCTTRVYSARIDGRDSKMTVALYQGRTAEEVWRLELGRYVTFRHPNLVQVYAAATSGNLYATVFHDELLPLEETLRMYHHSPISTAYLLGNFAMDTYDAEDHVFDLTGDILLFNSTLWIRASTGRLCVEVGPTADYPISTLVMNSLSADRLPQRPLSASPAQEAMIISALTLDQFHKICSVHMGDNVGIQTTVDLMLPVGSIMRIPRAPWWSRYDNMTEIANVVDRNLRDWGWNLASNLYQEPRRAVMGNGWTRFTSSEIKKNAEYIQRRICCGSTAADKDDWLPQANHIFECLRINSNYEEYCIVEGITYNIFLSDALTSNRPGYLFVCPLQDLQSEISGRFSTTHPDCPAYWTLDPLGGDRLTDEEAQRLGFPGLSFSSHVQQTSWGEHVYAGLRQFHAGKGFDPDSQDVARHVGVPLYSLSAESDALFARGEFMAIA